MHVYVVYYDHFTNPDDCRIGSVYATRKEAHMYLIRYGYCCTDCAADIWKKDSFNGIVKVIRKFVFGTEE